MDNGTNDWSVDWQNYDWTEVDKEIEEKSPDATEIQSMPKEQFLEYLAWMGENSPELLALADRMLKLERSGESPEELERLKALWNHITGND
jgi:hypothetical protein